MRLLAVFMVLVVAACAAVPDHGGPAPQARLYLRDKAPQLPVFSVPGHGKAEIMLHGLSPLPLALELRCDGAARIFDPESATRPMAAGQVQHYPLQPMSRGRARIGLGADVTQCQLGVTPRGALRYQIALRRDSVLAPGVARIDNTATECAPGPQGAGLRGLFHAPRALSQTCPIDPGPVELQPFARAAFQAKVRALTGKPLPETVLEAGDPQTPIDFGAAPRLELITLAYLHLRADYTGWMLMRMLAFHAARGTMVRILVSDAVMTRKDKDMLEHLAAQYPTIAVQFYRAPGFGLGRVHRVNHVKLFAVVGTEPAASVAMLGGRNLHDGFVFMAPRSLGHLAFLHDYDPDARITLYFFNAYKDFDVAIRDDAAVRQISAHVGRLWHRDPASGALPPPIVNPNPPPAGARVRHFLSMPQLDGQALEELYVDLFDRARDRVEMTSPFLNLPPRIEAALERALDRGVRVDLITRIDMPDPSGFLATTLNRMFIRRHAARVNVWAYPAQSLTLHAKYLLVDGELAVVTSTNLNRRSFAHDTENGVLIIDRSQVARLRQEFNLLKSAAQPVGPELAISSWRRALISFPPLRGVF